MKCFTALTIVDDILFENEDCVVHGLTGHKTFWLEKGTFFVFVYRGSLMINGEFPLKPGMYASLTHGYLQSSEKTEALVIQKTDFYGMRMMADIVEAMIQEGKAMDELCDRLQMETEEVVRLPIEKAFQKQI